MSRMPKTRKEYEHDLISAFANGMHMGYGIDHENIHKEESDAIEDFAKRNKFKTSAAEEYVKPFREFEKWLKD